MRGNDNTAMGYYPLWQDYNIAIGNRGVAGEAHTIRIGTTGTQTDAYIAGITGTLFQQVWQLS